MSSVIMKKGKCRSIDVAIPGNSNVIKKDVGEVLKYKDLTLQIQRLWSVKIKSDTGNNRGR